MKKVMLACILFIAAPLTLLAEECGMYVTADFIYWKASQEQLVYAVSGVNANQLPSIETGEYLQPDFTWNPGFKVGVGYYFCDCWDWFVQYTRYTSDDNTNSASASSSTTSTLIPGNSVEDLPITLMNGDWELYFNVIDVELGKTFCFCRALQLRPYVGLKGTWQDQDFKVQLTRTGATTGNNVFIVQKQDQDNWGIGLRGGFLTSWALPCNWCLYSNLAVSGIWTSFDTHRVDTSRDLDTGVVTPAVDIDYDFCSVDAVIELQLGLRWCCCPGAWCGRMTLQAGWEQQIWINHGQMVNLPTEGGVYNGDLNLHGLTARVRFDF